MRELSLSEIGMVSGGAGAAGAGLGAVAGATYYVVSNTLAGNQMDKAGFVGAVVEGAVMGTGVGVVARGANIAVTGAKKSCLTSPQIL